MIDFTNAIEEFNNYRGSEKKKTLIYNNKKYLVKFPDPIREKNKNISYINNAFSEYVGSNIFKIVGFKTQNTILGKYEYKGKEKIVCACEDFTDDENVLYEFENLALSTNPDKKIETELNDIMEVIEESKMIDTKEIKEKFWDMFIVDAIIGNFDRHGGNWGFIKRNNLYRIAPVYDNGSSLYPKLNTDDKLKAVLSSEEEINQRIYKFPTSHIKVKNRKSSYFEVITSLQFETCNEALQRIVPRIDLTRIGTIIDENLFRQVAEEFRGHKITEQEAMSRVGIASRSTFYRRLKEFVQMAD